MKQKPLNGFSVDPYTKTITPITIPGKNILKEFYSAIGCKIVEFVYGVNSNTTVVIDEEGMFVNSMYFRLTKTNPYTIIAGKGIVLSSDDAGDLVDATCSLEDLKAEIQFLNRTSALLEAKRIDEEYGSEDPATSCKQEGDGDDTKPGTLQ